MQIEASRGVPLSQFNAGQVGQRPPPPKEALSDVMEQAKSDPEVRDFLQSVREASASGSFDAEALAELAPDSLKSAAAEKGMDLATLFQQKHDARLQREGGGPLKAAALFSQLQFSTSAEGVLMSVFQTNGSIQTQA